MQKITKIILAIILCSLTANLVFAQTNEIQSFIEQVFSAGKLSEKDS